MTGPCEADFIETFKTKVHKDDASVAYDPHLINKGSDSGLFLSWSKSEGQQGPFARACISTSLGNVVCMRLDSEIALLEERVWTGAHEYGTWVAEFDRMNDNLIFSGGDDGCMRLWDMRESTDLPLWLVRCGYGVTSILPGYIEEHIIMSGSYDNNLRIWDRRNCKLPLQTTDLGGGVWRLKPHPESPGVVAVACSDAGFKIIKVDPSDFSARVLLSYEEHNSLGYGVSWLRSKVAPKADLIATCSFYDSRLDVWSVNISNLIGDR